VLSSCDTALQTGDFRPLGTKTYDVERVAITVAWKAFPPIEVAASHEHLLSHNALIYLPGWSFTERTKAIAPLCQAAAEYAQEMTYAVDTRAASIVPHSLAYEAEAVRRWLQESKIAKVTLIGDSQGGAKAMHLAVLLQESNPEIEVKALVLYNSVGLYDQPIRTLLRDYVQEGYKLRRGVARMVNAKEVSSLLQQNFTEGSFAIMRELLRSHIHYPRRLLNEIKEMAQANPRLSEIQVPVILVQGASDLLSHPARIIPAREGGDETQPSSYIKDRHERENFLQRQVFPRSPYVQMLVAEKMGYHALPSLRPKEVVRASLHLVKRWKRMHEQPDVQYPLESAETE
jgi:pimeloyl-ACP methyl ester carboxylesterase